MYPQLGAGGLHVFASAGSPVGTRPTGARSRTTFSVDGLDLLSTARRFMNEHSDDVRRWFG
jgi:hypothetical protein